MSHIKPTQEELQKNVDKTLAELEHLEDKPEVTPEPEPQPTPAPEPEPEPTPEPEPKPEPPKEGTDYKKKFVESTREGLVQYHKGQKLADAIDKASAVDEVTEDELKKKYTEWEEMTDLEKKLARETETANKRFAMLHEANKEFKDIDAWNKKVDEFMADPKSLTDYPDLDGKEEAFKVFATKPTRRGSDMPDLVNAFLWEESKQPKPKHKGSMFETGTGGPNDKPKPKSDKISVDQARVLRTTDYKKYLEYLRSDKIENDL